MNICKKCGNKLEEHWAICPSCGTSLEEIPQQSVITNKGINKVSEEKRFIKNKKTLVLSISLVAMCVLAGVIGMLFITTNNKHSNLTGDYNNLFDEHNDLTNDYDELLNNYQILTGDYDTLFDDYQDLQNSYNAICLVIKQSILPVQYSIFAEAVRRYYKDIYIGELSGKLYWKAFAEFCRDIILHESYQENSFTSVSNAFSDALKYGSNTMNLADYIMSFTFDYCDTIDFWGLDELAGLDDLTIMYNVIQQCIDEIDYEYDSDITYGQTYFDWDYIKFPVETAFRTKGDCEDQAILCAAYLESCGLETAIMIFHDPNHPTLGEFYHGVPLVHIEDTDAFYSTYPSYGGLWRLGVYDPYYPDEYTWCFLDPTWDVPFGSKPSWLTDYGGSISFSYCSVAFCDIDGAIGEDIGLTCVMPT